jgi:hypothetical protein
MYLLFIYSRIIGSVLRAYNNTTSVITNDDDRLHLRLQLIKRTTRGDEDADEAEIDNYIHLATPAINEEDEIVPMIKGLDHHSLRAEDLLPEDNDLINGEPENEKEEHTGMADTTILHVVQLYDLCPLCLRDNE